MNKVLMILLCIFLPPVAVLLIEGLGLHFLLNILLLIVSFGIGAIVHALYLYVRSQKALPT